jgi:hypothetical protein
VYGLYVYTHLYLPVISKLFPSQTSTQRCATPKMQDFFIFPASEPKNAPNITQKHRSQ